jgi:cleavage and polyadenylation specificity factor subunit 3
LLLDTGTDPEAEGEDSLPRLEVIGRNSEWSVDHAIVSHAHHDHIGSLPVVLRRFPNALVHMTGATRQLADILLPASARLQVRKMREGTVSVDPLFDVEDVEASSYMYDSHELDVSFDVTGANGRSPVRATLLGAGHVLGACGILIEYQKDGAKQTLFYTGDTSLRAQTILPGADYPDPPVDILLLESTLGADTNAEETTRRSEEVRFGNSIAEVLERKGVVLIPVFALGRGQEIIALIDRYRTRGVIPEDTPVYTAGLMRAISDIYDKTRFTTPRLNQDFEVFGVPQRRLPRSRSGLTDALSEPSIYLVGSGMMFDGV